MRANVTDFKSVAYLCGIKTTLALVQTCSNDQALSMIRQDLKYNGQGILNHLKTLLNDVKENGIRLPTGEETYWKDNLEKCIEDLSKLIGY